MTDQLPMIIPDLALSVPPQPGTVIVVDGILRAKVQEIFDAMGQLEPISDQRTFDAVRDVVKRASSLKSDIDACRERAKAPFLAMGQMIDKAAREVKAPLELVVSEGKAQETAFAVERDRQILLEAQRVREAEALAKVNQDRPTASLLPMVQAVAVAPITAFVAPISTRKVAKIVQEAMIPGEFWVVDMKKVEESWKAGMPVPGTVYETESYMVAR